MASLQGMGLPRCFALPLLLCSGGNLVTVAADGRRPYGSLHWMGSPWLWLPKGHDVALLTTSR